MAQPPTWPLHTCWTDQNGVSVPLRVQRSSSRLLGEWRPPLVGRLFFLIVGATFLVGNTLGVLKDPQWRGAWVVLSFVMGVALLVLPWRPLLRLHPDVVDVRGLFLSRLIPIEEVALVLPSRDGLTIWWGDGHCTTASFVGELGLVGELVGLGGRAASMTDQIMDARDAYLTTHGLDPRPNPFDEAQKRKDAFWQGRPSA